MLTNLYPIHNRFVTSFKDYLEADPHLLALSQLKYQHHFNWWKSLSFTPGIYILTGGRQIGKSTSCKLLIKHVLEEKLFSPQGIFYLPCDEIYDAKQLGETLRFILANFIPHERFLLIIDEVTYVKDWDRVIKALADEGHFQQGLCLLTGSDTLILKEAAMRFPGRRGKAKQTDFHLYPLTFAEYVHLVAKDANPSTKKLDQLFEQYLQCGGYLRAINDLGETGVISQATFMTYEQWIRGDFLKRGKNEDTLLALLRALLEIGVSQASYSTVTQKMGVVTKETCMDYCRLLQRMDILFDLQAFDQNTRQGFSKKARKFHFLDPFIYRTCLNWLQREINPKPEVKESTLVEACVASHCYRMAKTFYWKAEGEVDVIWLKSQKIQAIEVKWSEQLRPIDLKILKQFKNSLILTKMAYSGVVKEIKSLPVYEFLKSI
ncbi:MAG TPA: ATP-binding protein [Gammaproteobacteria bacterium]|nr:ATP-binding protein [Gammaproteobacteria bacterium]